jgi:hypothetical protein
MNWIIFLGLGLLLWYKLNNGKWTSDLVHGKIILRRIFRKWDGREWSELIWLRIGKGGGLLSMW